MRSRIASSRLAQASRRRGVRANKAHLQVPASAGPSVNETVPAAASRSAAPSSPFRAFLGVYVDPVTWGAAFFILVSFVTGILYLTWAVIGLGLSLSFAILVIGLPIAILFLLSIRGLGRLEARLVEASLGVNITARPLSVGAGSMGLERLKSLLADRGTWFSLLYLVLQMPLSVINFSVSTTLLILALGIMAAPLAQIFGDVPVIMLGQTRLWLPFWGVALMEIVGFLLLTLTLHVIRLIGRWHAKYAAFLLAG